MTRSALALAHPKASDAGQTPALFDEALAARIRRGLDQAGYAPLRSVRVSTTARGHVRLEGVVPSFYLKQVAQAAALGIEGVQTVENRLQVCGIR